MSKSKSEEYVREISCWLSMSGRDQSLLVDRINRHMSYARLSKKYGISPHRIRRIALKFYSLNDWSTRPVFFPPGDTTSLRRSHWREFIEARDTVLTVLARPLLPSELLQAGPTLGPLLANPERERLSWHEAAQSTLTQLG